MESVFEIIAVKEDRVITGYQIKEIKVTRKGRKYIYIESGYGRETKLSLNEELNRLFEVTDRGTKDTYFLTKEEAENQLKINEAEKLFSALRLENGWFTNPEQRDKMKIKLQELFDALIIIR